MSNKKIVFISHITEEKELAEIFSISIKEAYLGMLDTFVSSDRSSLQIGEKWLDSIDDALNQSAIQLSLCSPKSITRPWINFEAGASWIRKIPVIPVCHSGLQKGRLPIPLAMLQAANANDEDDLKEIFTKLSKILGSKTPNVDYKDLSKRIFEYEEKNIFINESINAVLNISYQIPSIAGLFFAGEGEDNGQYWAKIEENDFHNIKSQLTFLKTNDLINFRRMAFAINEKGTEFELYFKFLPKYICSVLPELKKHYSKP